MDKKNLIIAVLAGLLVFGSLWGQVGNKNSKALRHELEQVEKQLSAVETTNSQTHDEVLTKTAALQKTLQGKEKQLMRARKELVSLRKANKGLEAQLSERDAIVHKLMAEKKQLPAEVEKPDSDQVASQDADKITELEKQIVALQKALKKKRPQTGRTQNAVIVQLADAQKQVMALQKELKNKDKLLAQNKSTSGTEQAGDLQKEMSTLQAELKKRDEQLAQVQKNAASQVAALEEQLTALQEASKETGHQNGGVLEGVTPVQFAYFQAELKKKNKQLAHALSMVEDLQKEMTVLQAELEKKVENVTQGQRAEVDHGQVAVLQKKIAVLQAELEKKNASSGIKQFVRIQDHETNQGTDIKEQLTALKAELKKKDEQMAALQQSQIPEQAINQLQEKVVSLQSELKTKDEQFIKDRGVWSDQIADLKTKLTGMMNELTSRGDQLAALQKELQDREQSAHKEIKETEETVGPDVVKLQENLAAVQAQNQELVQALQNAQQSQQGQTADSHELETAKAQILGLEKIVEEKNAVIEEISHTLERVKINMDVLLNRIGDLQNGLREVQEANRELVKDLTVKNKELADLKEQLQAVPAQ
jgi:chromosome segregation ATPase